MVGTAELGWIALAGLTWSMGIVSGIGINTAHELGHKKPESERCPITQRCPITRGTTTIS